MAPYREACLRTSRPPRLPAMARHRSSASRSRAPLHPHSKHHSSVLDLVFYEGEQFPAEYRGDAFVALKGSWNRSEPTGYKVVRGRFKDGRPGGSYENVASGFWVSASHRAGEC